MVSKRPGFEGIKNNNSLDKLAENTDSKADDISWLIDNLPITVFRASSKLSWGMDYISKNVEKLTGYSKMDFIDQKLSWSDIVLPEDISIIDKAVQKAKKNKSSYQVEYRIKKSDGSTALIQEQAHLVCDDKGNLAYRDGIFLDSTSQIKQREDSHKALKEDEKIQLEMLRSFVERISRGEIPERITDNYSGDFNEIKNNLNNCIDGLQGLVECNNVLNRMAVNDHTKGVEGKYVGIYASMGEATNDVRSRLLNVINQLNNIAIGNTSPLADLKKIGKRSEQDQLLPAIFQAMENIDLLIEDVEMLSRAAIEGKLDTRADASKHKGEYRKVVEGVNETLDAVIGPLNVAAEYVERISRGDVPELITDNYNGDFNEIKNNLNTCIVAVNNLVEDAVMLADAGIAGRLDTRADATRHEGDFRKVVSGVNDTLDAVIGPLNVAAEYVERISRGDIPKPITDNYNGDFNEIKNNLNTCIVAVNNLVEDAVMLSEAAVAGKLNTRAEATRHEGDFRKIVSGVNGTLDAVIGPLNEAIRVSNEFSNGNFRARVDENLHVEGDFINFKHVLNNIGVSVSEVIKSAKSVTVDVVECSNEASKGADEVAKAAGDVAMSSQKSSELTRELLYKIEGINREVIDLSVSNEKISGTSKGILSAANEVVRIGKDAQVLGKETNLKMENVEKIAKNSVDGINSLTEQIKQIDSIVQLINDITSQINLLSLNASIEAARAGEHGRGFAVVAGEVKNLASKARNATETIETVVNSVQ